MTVAGTAAVLGYLALLIIAAVSARSGVALQGTSAAASFVDAFERSRLATYAMEGTFVRRSETTGDHITSPFFEAQRPPRRIVNEFGGVQGRVDDQPLLCGAKPDAKPGCSLGPPGTHYTEWVAEQVAVLRTYVDGAKPLYEVVAEGRCYNLRQTRYQPLSPYGEQARLCFDEATGALARLRVDHGGVVDDRRATTIRPQATDAELEPS